MSTTATETKGREYAHEHSNLWSALSAALLGLVSLYGVGFAPWRRTTPPTMLATTPLFLATDTLITNSHVQEHRSGALM